MARKKQQPISVQMIDWTPPTQSVVIGDHAEFTGQFCRDDEDGLMASGEVQDIGPDVPTYGYRTRRKDFWGNDTMERNVW